VIHGFCATKLPSVGPSEFEAEAISIGIRLESGMAVDPVPDKPGEPTVGLFDHPLAGPLNRGNLALRQDIGDELSPGHAEWGHTVALPPRSQHQGQAEP
jgi:hypothetical protein